MTLLSSQPRSISATAKDTVAAEDIISAERLDELRAANVRLQLLVCELLMKNQQLRLQRADE
ncbi:MAG: hypothetical protein ACJ72H_27940 [Candidatus Sulfotelmatobacter sp.]